ncbi:hypothetical protein NSA50_17805 [Clostridium sp. DSM 100503]|uniref:hypothetical protein n=1 Tax=Clostridium sp. DSM 100503 TaxID=2963282 RepID=UPI00214A7BC4|nr:hypothetical protein [Clostridium sp. DSM 100503]MCR1952859.1 hypothetical protein [Clostridium sp. DSM 100503]
MLDTLINNGNKFKDYFTAEYNYVELGIVSEKEADYISWMSKVGVFCESQLKDKYPKMSEKILEIVKNQSVMKNDFSMIMGYLESANELEK